jgi:hypothetical protein
MNGVVYMKVIKGAFRIKFIVPLIIVGVIVFGVFHFKWIRYIENTYEPFIKMLDSIEGLEHDIIDSSNAATRWSVHSYKKSSNIEGSYIYNIGIPPYMDFGGYITILVPTAVDIVDNEYVYISDYYLSLSIYPNKWSYSLSLADMTYTSVGDIININSSPVDKSGNPIGRHHLDTEEKHQEWLALYEKFHEPIIDLFDHIKELFGEDAFR